MDKYKKKPLKFSGMGREMRTAELNAARGSSRLQRFSLLRPIEDDEVVKETVPSSKIPTFGKPKSQVETRIEMLKKWKEEKMFKKKIEMQSKKPEFKVGISKKFPPSSASFDKVGRFGELSRIQSFQTSKIQPCIKTSGIKSKNYVSTRTAKPLVTARPEPKENKSKDSTTSSNLKPPKVAITDVKGMKKDLGSLSNRKLPKATSTNGIAEDSATSHSKPPKVTNTDVKGLRKDLATSNSKPPKVTNTDAKGIRKIPYSGVPKPTISLLPQRKLQNSTSNPMRSTAAISKSNPQNLPSKVNKPVKSSNPAQVKQTGRAFGKPAEKSNLGKALPKKEAEKLSASENQDSRFACQISLIEPVEAEKSFAPKGFLFCPPVELQTSWFLDNGPSAIFTRVKNDENARTSTPKRSEWNESQEQINSSYTQETPCTMNDSTTLNTKKNSSGSVPSSETKYIESLLDNSPSEIKMPEPSFPQKEILEQQVASKILTPNENLEIIHFEDKYSETGLSEPSPETESLNALHPKDTTFNTDVLEPSCIASPILLLDTKDPQIISAETASEQAQLGQNELPEVCFPTPNETKGLTSDISLLEIDPGKSTAFEFCLPTDLASDAASEFDSSQKNQAEKIPAPCLPETNHTEGALSTCSSFLNKSANDETCSHSDSVFLSSPSVSNETKSKIFPRRYRRTEKPSMLKISESPENRETPKEAERPKGHQMSSDIEFTPRRSARLARLSQFNSVENLFEVRESLVSSPGTESSRLTYDFDRLHLESAEGISEEPPHRVSTRSITAPNRISLLYTPPRTRASTRKKSLWGDLMTFSPNV